MVTCYPSYDMTPPLPSPAQCGAHGGGAHGGGAATTTATHKDYSRPLHVDCSVEYELPDAAKPPAGQRSEPLLMIHPCYYRRAEAQRRTRFVNNLPKSSLSSPVGSNPRRSKVARLTPAVEWTQPKPLYPAPPPPSLSSCYKVGATADFSAAFSAGRTPGHIAPAAPSSAKLGAGAVLSDIIASTCSELNNNYMKQQQHPSAQQTSSQQQQQAPTQQSSTSSQPTSGSSTPSLRLYDRQLSTYQQLPYPHLQQDSCKTCQYQPQHPHHHHVQSQASQATQVNRLYGGGLVKAVEPNPELAANPVPAKVRRCGVKRSRSSRALPQALPQDCSAVAGATPSWSDAMLQLNAGFSFESPGVVGVTGPWGAYGAPHHAPAPGPAPGTTADPLSAQLGAWGAMYCREREDDTRVLWNSDSLLRLVPV